MHYTPFSHNKHYSKYKMLVSVFIALLLPCAAMLAVFFVYIFLIWYTTSQGSIHLVEGLPVKSSTENGLSASYLEKLPKLSGKDLVLGRDCAVCLEDIEINEAVRLVPGCNHGFHVECADTSLSKNSICPVCRARLTPETFDAHLKINTV